MTALRSGIPDDWDDQLQRAGGHFLQSRAWQQVQARLGYEVVAQRGDSWLWSGSIRPGRFPRYLYVPYGPVGPDMEGALTSLAGATHRHGLDFARIEPMSALSSDAPARFHARAARPVQPRWTWILDLAVDEAELRRGLSAGHRGSINAAARHGLAIRRSTERSDASLLADLQRRAGSRSGFSAQRPAYYQTVLEVLQPLRRASLYVAEAEGQPVAAAICYDFAGTRYYAHAASDPALGRRLGAAAPLVWQMVLDARSEGKTCFDFWGVAPPGVSGHRWAGFTQFKQAFGGHLVERPGAFEMPLRPVRHRVFSLAQSLRR